MTVKIIAISKDNNAGYVDIGYGFIWFVSPLIKGYIRSTAETEKEMQKALRSGAFTKCDMEFKFLKGAIEWMKDNSKR